LTTDLQPTSHIIDCHNHIGAEIMMYLAGNFPYGQHLTHLTSDARANGVERLIVFPMVSHVALDFEAMQREQVKFPGGLAKVPYEWENRRMMEEIYDLFPEEGKCILPFVMIDPAREPEAQVAALRKLREQYPAYGIKMQTTIIQSPVKSLLEQGRVFLELAEEWDVPMLIHSSVLPSDIWAQASDILDVAEASPNVRFCVAHSLRFDRVQLDRLAQLPNCWYDCSAHRIHCELATKNSPVVAPIERRFDSDYSNPTQVLRDMAEAYPNKLMWGSDSPYYSWVAITGDIRYALISDYAAEADCVKALPRPLLERVGWLNTLDCLKMGDK